MIIGRILYFLFFVIITSCGDDDNSLISTSNIESLLVGKWTTQGEDPDLGAVTVELYLMEDNSLRLTLFSDEGVQRSFPGSWIRENDELVLRGFYFGPEGERRVIWLINDDGSLLLQDKLGNTQEWSR